MDGLRNEHNGEENNNEGDDVVQTELEYALINYTLTPDRIFFLRNSVTWFNFHNSYSQNLCKYRDYTARELGSYFLRKILPKINKFELQIEQKKVLELLELHPNFVMSQGGFKMVNLPEEILKQTDLTNESPQLSYLGVKGFSLEPSKNDSSHSLVELRNKTACNNTSGLSDENHILLSLLLSTNGELSNQEYVSLDSINKRLHDTKKFYEDTALLPESLNTPLVDVLNKVKSFVLVKRAIESLLKH